MSRMVERSFSDKTVLVVPSCPTSLVIKKASPLDGRLAFFQIDRNSEGGVVSFTYFIVKISRFWINSA